MELHYEGFSPQSSRILRDGIRQLISECGKEFHRDELTEMLQAMNKERGPQVEVQANNAQRPVTATVGHQGLPKSASAAKVEMATPGKHEDADAESLVNTDRSRGQGTMRSSQSNLRIL